MERAAGRLVIAGTHSGVGKTTITMGLLAALHRRGLQVQPFKAGPDYIDPTYHALAAGRPCRNIDTWMVPPPTAVALFERAAEGADLAIVEGVMGVFDGYSYEDDEGSSAQIAKLLGAPVILVLDVGAMARSSGALASGYASFDPDLNVAGFILNRCGSANHYEGTKLAVERASGLPVVGWVPKDASLAIPERHLGLVPTNERGELTELIDHAAEVVEEHFDLERLIAIAEAAAPLITNAGERSPMASAIEHAPRTVLAVARDEAFGFYYYDDNLDLLREHGAEIAFFSPLTDTELPTDTSGIYLGGGFPEVHAARLSANSQMLDSLRRAAAEGIPVYAECGGFMYLTEAIVDLDGAQHSMVGLVPGQTRMAAKLTGLGYRTVESPSGNFLLRRGESTRGHEFHWSTWEGAPDTPAWTITPRRDGQQATADGYALDNIIASYIHLHFAAKPEIAARFVEACQTSAVTRNSSNATI